MEAGTVTLCGDTIVARRKRVHLAYDETGELIYAETDLGRMLDHLADIGYTRYRVPLPRGRVAVLTLEEITEQEPETWQK